MLMTAYGATREASDSSHATSQVGGEVLNDLIAWLQRQPEPEFRHIEARRLCDQMQLYGVSDEALEALEEAVQVVVGLDDLTLTKEVAGRVVELLPRLLYITQEDLGRYSEALVVLLDEDEHSPPDPNEIGVSDPFVSRLERLADALSDLADCLDVEDDEHATELHAALLLGELDAVGKLGQGEKVEARYESFARLGDAALAACDARIEIFEGAVRDGRTSAAQAVPASMMMKAGVLMLNDEDDTALVVLTEIIDRFEQSEEPVIAAIVRKAQEMQTDLLEESDDESS
jgi:hypothetical protein